jgi:hypothetical protein
MEFRFYIDPETRQPHIYNHGITEDEVQQVFAGSGEDTTADRNSRMRLGQTVAGRYLQIIYAPDEGGESAFVITACELRGKAKKAFRRRRRRKKR